LRNKWKSKNTNKVKQFYSTTKQTRTRKYIYTEEYRGYMELELPPLNCKRCGHEWYPARPKLPKVCPKCKSPYWNKERKNKGQERGELDEQ
jgi:predicted Zn-ribbon and HTH transcriptional regulator